MHNYISLILIKKNIDKFCNSWNHFCNYRKYILYQELFRSPNFFMLKVEINPLKKYREGLLLSKTELARKAGISALTIDRVERGEKCRLDTKRKIILALGLKLTDRGKIFGNQR